MRSAEYISMADCSIKMADNAVKIYIDGILHLSILKDELIGLQSWRDEVLYCIEYTLRSNTIMTEYTEQGIWEAILKLLDATQIYPLY